MLLVGILCYLFASSTYLFVTSCIMLLHYIVALYLTRFEGNVSIFKNSGKVQIKFAYLYIHTTLLDLSILSYLLMCFYTF